MTDMMKRCTVIEGDVHILLVLAGNVTNEDFRQIRFERLREITGHLLIFQVQ